MPGHLARCVAVVIVFAPLWAAACECNAPVGDPSIIAKVQSTWPDGFRYAQAGNYARALRVLHSTAGFVRLIRDGRSRACVAAGEANLIGMATAGQAYVTLHPRDPAGAKAAASRAWRVFLPCP